jgi:hypothetical protein
MKTKTVKAHKSTPLLSYIARKKKLLNMMNHVQCVILGCIKSMKAVKDCTSIHAERIAIDYAVLSAEMAARNINGCIFYINEDVKFSRQLNKLRKEKRERNGQDNNQ